MSRHLIYTTLPSLSVSWQVLLHTLHPPSPTFFHLYFDRYLSGGWHGNRMISVSAAPNSYSYSCSCSNISHHFITCVCLCECGNAPYVCAYVSMYLPFSRLCFFCVRSAHVMSLSVCKYCAFMSLHVQIDSRFKNHKISVAFMNSNSNTLLRFFLSSFIVNIVIWQFVAWSAYIKFEMRQGEITRARSIYER